MVFTKSGSMILVLLVACFALSSATLYKIDWSNKKLVNYKTWASTQHFHVGDVIHFQYDATTDNVVRVTHKHYRSCNASEPISVRDSGDDLITIKSHHAHLYFISAFAGRCQAGNKVDFRVAHPSPASDKSDPSTAPSPAPDVSVAQPSLPSKVAALIAIIGVLIIY